MPRRHPADGTDWNTLDDGCPSPREATSTYFAPKAQDYVPSACSTRIADDKRLSKPRQGAELCTLGTQCPRLCKQYRVRDKHSLPNPRRRRTSAHPQHEILSPGRHHIGAQPLPKAQACAPSTSVTPHGKAAEAPNPAQGTSLCTLGAAYPSQKGSGSAQPPPTAQTCVPSARVTLPIGAPGAPNPYQGCKIVHLRARNTLGSASNAGAETGTTRITAAQGAKLCTLGKQYQNRR